MRRRRGGPPFVEIGLFAVLTAAVIFATFYFVSNFGRGKYQMGVRFTRAYGVAQGAQVLFSGVDIGSVDQARLLPDNTVELILAINSDTSIPKASKFIIRPSLTGSPTVVIEPPPPQLPITTLPTPLPSALVFERRVLPPSEQPVGSGPPGFEELLLEGKGLAQRSTRVLNMMVSTRGRVFGSLQASRANALALQAQMHDIPATILADLKPRVRQLQANLAVARGALRVHDHRQLAVLASSLKSSAAALNATTMGFRGTTASPQVRANMRASQQQLSVAMSNMRVLQKQSSGLTGDPQTRLQLADATAQLRAALQRIGSLLKPSAQGSPPPEK